MNTSDIFPLRGKKIWVAGHNGMVGRALVKRLASEGGELLTAERNALDLTDQAAVDQWIGRKKPDAIFVAAARVGGIWANNNLPAEFIHTNLAIGTNIIHAAYTHGVSKLLYLASSCIYPRMAPQPAKEAALLTGPFEPTNQWYAIAKVAGVMMCAAYRRQYGCDFIGVVPANLYGPHDSFDPQESHVIPGLIQKFHQAKKAKQSSVDIWGTGKPLREFMHVDDAADALVMLMRSYSDEPHINVGWGKGISVAELAAMIAQVTGYSGALTFDDCKPDGMPRKVLDVMAISKLGWIPSIDLRDGLASTYQWYLRMRLKSLSN